MNRFTIAVVARGVSLIVLLLPYAVHGNETVAATAAPALAPDPGILTPPPNPTPRINGPSIFGARPGSPFLYTVPATGTRPMTYAADGLPPGLALDSATGRITGSLTQPGEYRVTLHATNALGKADKPFRIVIGDTIALTPPMGWSSWNCLGDSVSQAKVLETAHAIVDKGLNQHGWTYVNIDDGWQGPRGGPHNALQPNPKFPDMKGLVDQVHGMGLKFGIYSTPWALSYAGYAGSGCTNASGIYDWIADGNHNDNFKQQWKHTAKTDDKKKQAKDKLPVISFAANDAAQWADWGVDYLKYDWYLNDVTATDTMSTALRKSGRDVVFSLSNSAPFEYAADWARLANCWRTTGDIEDSWKSVSKIGFNQAKWAPFAGPGHWNDPDMLIAGTVGWGKPKPTTLTHDEQYTHISLWCLLSAPLLVGCDLAKLDDFTVNLLSNDEVLDVDQDALGKEATPVYQDKEYAIYMKPMEDGSCAVGLFNLSGKPQKIETKWSDLKLDGPQRVRDLWRQKDAGVFANGFSSEVGPHGVMLIRVWNSAASLGAAQ